MTEEKWTVIRFPKSLIAELRRVMPEVADEKDATVVRVAVKKFIDKTKENK